MRGIRPFSISASESGAALVTTMLISLLLLTACVAMLSAVGANSRDTTDVISDTKAYYAAESGLQATINVLRYRTEGDGTSVSYTEAAGDTDLSTWLPYNYPLSGTADRVVIGQAANTYDPNAGAAYSITVRDPDHSGDSTTFYTVGGFAPATGATFVTSRTFGASPDTTTISYTGIATPTAINHPGQNTQNIGYFTLTKAGAGATIPVGTRFSVDYVQTLPRPGYKSFGGTIQTDQATGVVEVQFDSASNVLLGATISLLDIDMNRKLSLVMPSAVDTPTSTQMRATIGATEPYRLVVNSKGYGPNGARKELEGILQRNPFNGLASGAATSMIGPQCPAGQTCFAPGTSNGITYNGCSAIGCVPSFGLTDPNNLAYVQSHPPGGNPSQMTPPPALLTATQLPSWQSSPAALDTLVDTLRTAAQNDGRYFVNPTGNLQDPGNFANGTGITFCEGSCQVGGDGGGTLVVTGQLTNLGGFSFKGTIIVTGEGGWLRNGGGNGQVIGNVVIAPYNRSPYVPENLSSAFLPPIYQITGGGGSDVIYGDVTAGIDNTSAISNLMAGVAEK